MATAARICDGLGEVLTMTTRTSNAPLFLITHPSISHCIWACSAKGGWSLFSLSSLSLLPLSPLYTVSTIVHRAVPNMQRIITFSGPLPRSQGQKLALTVLYVPYSLDSDFGFRDRRPHL